MAENDVIRRPKQDAKQGRAPSTQAGEFVREEVEHIRSGVPGARPAKQASAIGMSRGHRYVSSILLAVALFSPVVFSGCAVHASYRVYDPGHEDYHVWDSNEVGYYQRWEVETHRDHRDFHKRNSDEQKEYWNWRHNHN